MPTFSQYASCAPSYLFTWFHVGPLGQANKYLRGIIICFNSYLCKNKCNICILTFTTLISRYNCEEPDAKQIIDWFLCDAIFYRKVFLRRLSIHVHKNEKVLILLLPITNGPNKGAKLYTLPFRIYLEDCGK